MSWPNWNSAWSAGQTVSAAATPTAAIASTAAVATALPTPGTIPVNPAQYTAEQWATMQQQNWQQWVQWQQQYQQWQQQYGEQYQKSLSALSAQTAIPPTPVVPAVPAVPAVVAQQPIATVVQPPLPATFNTQPPLPFSTNVAPPPLPPDNKPPPPPEQNQQVTSAVTPTYNYSQPPPNINSQPLTFNKPPPNQFSQPPPPVAPPPPATTSTTSTTDSTTVSNFTANTSKPPPSLLSLRVDKPTFDNAAPVPPPPQNKRKFNDQNRFNESVIPEKAARTSGGWNQDQQDQRNDPNVRLQQPKSGKKSINPNEITEAERKFDEQFKAWEEQFNKWKEQNANHPDKQQYKEYEAKWEAWRNQLLERREQMRKKRMGLAVPKTSNKITPPLPVQTTDLVQKKPPPQQQPQTQLQQELSLTESEKKSENFDSKPVQEEQQDLPTKIQDSIEPKTDFYNEPPKEQRQRRNRRLNDTSIVETSSANNVEEDTNMDESNTSSNYEFMSKNDPSGIPGLDLVDEKSEKKEEEEEDANEKKAQPDLSAISRGIDSILGDQNLANIISLVSQQKQGVVDTNKNDQNMDLNSNQNNSQLDSSNSSQSQNTSYVERPNDGKFIRNSQIKILDNRPYQPPFDSQNPIDRPPYQETNLHSSFGTQHRPPFESQQQSQFTQRSTFDNQQRPPFDNQRPSLDNQRPLLDNQRPPLDNQRGPLFDSQRPPFDNQRPSFDNQRGPSFDNQRGSSFDNQRGSSFDNQRGSSFDNQRGPSFDNQRGSSFDNQRGSSFDNQRGSSFDSQRPPFENQPRSLFDSPRSLFDNQRLPFNNQRPPFDNQRGPPQFDNQRPSQFDNQRPQFDNQRPPFDDQRPPFDNQRPSFDNQRPPFDNQRPPLDNQRPPLDNQRPPLDNQRPPFDNQRPSFDNQRPPFDNQRGPPFDNQRGAPFDNQRSSFDSQRGPPPFDDRNRGSNFNNQNDNRFSNDRQQFDRLNQRNDDDNSDNNRFGSGLNQPQRFDNKPPALLDLPMVKPMPDPWLRPPPILERERMQPPNDNLNRPPPLFGNENLSRPPPFNEQNMNRPPPFGENLNRPPPFGENLNRPPPFGENMNRPFNENMNLDKDRSFNENPPTNTQFLDKNLDDTNKPVELGVTEENIAKEGSQDDINSKTQWEGDILAPATIIDYGHKSLAQRDEDAVFIEPVQTIDYEHQSKNVPINESPKPSWSQPKYTDKKYSRDNYTTSSDLSRSNWKNNAAYEGYKRDESRDYSSHRSNYGSSGLNEKQNSSLGYDRRYGNRSRSYDESSMSPKDRYERRSSYHYDKRNQDSGDKISSSLPSPPEIPRERKIETLFPAVAENSNMSTNPSLSLLEKETEKHLPVQNVTLVEDLLSMPGRANRPPRMVIILRGPPGSGKTFLAKLIKDKEVSQGGSAPRILSLDDYFMVEIEKDSTDPETGRKIKTKEMVYEYEQCMETAYISSLVKAFKKTITDGFFSFIIVDCVNHRVKQYEEMWSFAKQNGFQVYICQMELDVTACIKRNIHGRTEDQIRELVDNWELTPVHHLMLDATSLLQAACISEVEMDEVSDDDNLQDLDSPKDNDDDDQAADEAVGYKSKWELMEHTFDKLARLDGISKPLRHSTQSMEDYLQLNDEWKEPEAKPGQKRVRWADLVEQREQEKMRAIGFVVGQTDWNRMMDPSQGSSALTQTKFIEPLRKY